jgi:phage terminase small subunit
MPALSNARHEKFAQEISKGKTATEAYVLAGYKPNDGNAATLKGNQRVLERIAELQEAGSLRVEVTIASLIQEAAEIQTAAMADGQHSAAVAALTAKAKLAGLWIDKNENTNRNVDPTAVSDAELAAVVAGECSQGTVEASVDKTQLN